MIIMQNKANFQKRNELATSCSTKAYKNELPLRNPAYKPDSNPTYPLLRLENVLANPIKANFKDLIMILSEQAGNYSGRRADVDGPFCLFYHVVMTERLVAIANFAFGPDPVGEAHLARLRLQEQGVPCYLDGEYFASTLWLYSMTNQGVKLMVKESDVQRAQQILGKDANMKLEEGDEVNPACPSCGSEDVEFERFSRTVFYISILIFRFPVPWFEGRYKCRSCGHKWKKQSPQGGKKCED